jgi:alcohol-forming fatty acyl-CoA reductase
MSLNLHGAFSGRTIFFTGVTGFVGKVFLFLLLKNFPDLKRVYVLIRTKKGQKPQDRFVEVLKSQCFAPLKEAVGEAEFQRRMNLVTAIAGDITEDRLGIDEKHYAELCNNVNFIAHLAATVDFQEKLNLSVQMNTLGALRVVALARKCRQLESMVHTSTCYVNWARDGRENPVKEQLYTLPFDPEAMCKHILSLHPSQIQQETKELLSKYNFPNTYTFTKSMGEHLVRKNKGRLPITIVRPSIIGCSYRDPCPGWVDALTAAGGLFLTVGLGIVSEFQVHGHYIADIVPVDHVCSVIIKALYKTALHHKMTTAASATPQVHHAPPSSLGVSSLAAIAAAPKGSAAVGIVHGAQASQVAAALAAPVNAGLAARPAESVSSDDGSTFPLVFHASTSACMNNLTWELAKRCILDFWNSGKRHPRAISKADVMLIPNPVAFWVMHSIRRLLPFYAMNALAHLPPPVGSEQKRKMVGKYEKALARSADLRFQFLPFVSREWVYDQANQKFLDEGLSQKALNDFPSDTYQINWWTFIQLYNYGMCKFIIKSNDGRSEPVVPASGAEVFTKASL